MKFSELPYERINFSKVKQQAEELVQNLSDAKDFLTAERVFLEWDKLSSLISTASSLANVRHTINTEDVFYAEEKDYYDEISPQYQELSQNFIKVMLETPFRKDFETKYGDLYFKNAEIEMRTFTPSMIADLQQENRLVSEYVKLIASAQVEFEGETLTLAQMTPHMQSTNTEKRIAAWNAYGSFFMNHAEQFDSIFDQLVTIRTKLSQTLGHKNFIALGYDRMTRNSYNEKDVEKFREAVQKHLVPVVTRLKQEQAKRNGVAFPMKYPDAEIKFPSGNAKPTGTPDEILAYGQKLYRELSPETAEFIDFMMENELFDVVSRKGKASGGYCTEFSEYKSPFVFANFNGTAGDIEVITHEAGHAFAAYQARNIVPLENRQPTMESAEVHSMSMEFFAWPWCEGFFGNQTQKFYYQHLEGALTFIPYGTMVDHFQHEIYKNPEMTPTERHQLWSELEKKYRPWYQDTETPFYKDGRFWQRQIHIYEMPFYYIDYCLAQTVALQFWATMQENREDAWKRYMKFVSKAGMLTFDGLVKTADMTSPFNDSALKDVADAATKWLNQFDQSTLM
ncbi:M3 family oligoendopeptidase [Scatolibacter rhodanostii]|uniref:M3 family oligoendopeptidase n=1 Tax=Scatolibacter rhodanostii TaxID=2014781 RepID=UPI000C07AE47|nr:M3 family oligoendopeptidase [Scatolibacter rhodanostii]